MSRRAGDSAIALGLLCLFALAVQALSSAVVSPGMHSEEELYNAAHALIIRDGGWDLAWPFRYHSECGGCAVVASMGSVVFSWVAPSIGAWRSIGLLFFTLALFSGLALGWKVARYWGAGAVALVFAAAPPTYQRLAMVVNGNHSEGGALLLVEVVLAATAATARTPLRRGFCFVLLLVGMSAGVPFLLSLQLGLILPFLVIVLASASRWERLALWPGLLVGGTVAGLLPYVGLFSSMASRETGSHESGQLVLSSSFIAGNLWTLVAPGQVRGIWGSVAGPLGGRLGWLSFAALCTLLLLGLMHCVGELRRTRTLSIPARVYLFPASTLLGFVALYLLYERQIGSGGLPSPGQVRYLGLIYPTALCSAALAAALAAQRGGPRRMAAGFLLVVLLVPGAWVRASDARLLSTQESQGTERYAPASAFAFTRIFALLEQLQVPLERAPMVGRLDVAGMSRGRASVRAGELPGLIEDDRVKEAWAFGALRELMGAGFNSGRSPAELLAKVRPHDDGGPSEDLLAALGVDEPREGGANSLDRWLLRNVWTFQRSTLAWVYSAWDDESLANLLPSGPLNSSGGPLNSSGAPVDPYGLILGVSAAGLGAGIGPLATRRSDRVVVPPGDELLWRGPAPPVHLLEAWAWAWAWGFGAEIGVRHGPGVRFVDLSVDVPAPTAVPEDLWPVLASALGQGLSEGYSYGSWLDWIGPREAPPPQVQVALFGAGETLYPAAPAQAEDEVVLPAFRSGEDAESRTPEGGRSDLVLGGNGVEWRDLRGGSPRDFPGDVGYLGEVSQLSFCTFDSGLSCVPLLDEAETCAVAVARSANRQTTATPVPPDWMSRVLSCRSSGSLFPDLPEEITHAVSLGSQLLVLPSHEEVGENSRTSVSCAEEGLASLGRGLSVLGRDIGRELYLESTPLRAEGETGLEVAALPVHLVDLPHSLSPARSHLITAALRSRGRRSVLPLGGDASLSLAGSLLARHLVWGGAVKIEGQPTGGLLDLLAFGAEHRDLVGMAEAPLGVVFSLAGWSELSEPDRRELMTRSEALLEGLAQAGVVYEVLVLGAEHRGTAPVERAGLALQRFERLVLPQANFSSVERSALTALAEARVGKLGFVGTAVSESFGASGFTYWKSPEEVVLSMRRAGLGVTVSVVPETEGADSSQTPVHVSRHVVGRNGGVAFHLVPQDSSVVSLGLSIPKRLVPSIGTDWWFHHAGGNKLLLSALFDPQAQSPAELVLPPFSGWGILEARPKPGVGGTPDLQIVGARERTIFVSVWDEIGEEDLALIFPENLSPRPMDHSGFEWTVDAGGRTAAFKWPVRPVSVAGSIQLVSDRIDLEVTFTNHSSETLSAVDCGLCLAPTSDKGFPRRFYDRSWLVGPEGPRSLADLRTASGASPLHVETSEFSWPVVIEESVGLDRSMVFAFDGASGIGGNAWGASVCLHIRPRLEQLEPGASATLRGVIYFVDGPVDAAVSRLEQEGWADPSRRFGPMATSGSFGNGLPPRRPPFCAAVANP